MKINLFVFVFIQFTYDADDEYCIVIETIMKKKKTM